ncbi:MAG: Nre family DNA repair protein [Candidatus Thermoplasmatota archaeon]
MNVDLADEEHFVQSKKICAQCRGSKNLCGRERCPVMVKYYHRMDSKSLVDDTDISGSSPPGVFVGRYGYPKVDIGPLVPPFHGDTSELDMPELWVGKDIDDIVENRTKLVRGKYPVRVDKSDDRDKVVDFTQQMALSKDPAEVEAFFKKKPGGKIQVSDSVQPYGPSGPLKELDLGTIKFDKRLDKAYFDSDLKAVDAVLNLYEKDVYLSKIQRAFSVGSFGLEENRRFVPTRWSITAVDDTIGKNLRDEVKDYRPIDEYRVYEAWELDNRWEILMLPRTWIYELVEAWYPETAWNPHGKDIAMISSHERYEGRSDYAEIGGCFYAARLAVAEKLSREKRQAGAVILRETHPGYIMPVGVWNVREHVREALKKEPNTFDTLKEALFYISTRLDIKVDIWKKHSEVLRDSLYQTRLTDFDSLEDGDEEEKDFVFEEDRHWN